MTDRSPLIAAWHRRSSREQVLIGLMLALLVGVLGWFAVVAPLMRAEALAQARRDLAAARLAQVEAAARVAGAAPAARSGNLESLVVATAAQAGLNLTTQGAAGPGAITVALDQTDAAGFFTWAQTLAEQGVAVTNLTATSTGGGQVRIEAVLASGG